MESALTLTLPIFAIALLGYLAVRFNYLPQSAADGLMRFVVAVVVPLVVFRAFYRVGIPNNINNVLEIWGAYFGGAAAVMLAAIFAARSIPELRGKGMSVAMAASHGNILTAGLPVVVLIVGFKYIFAISLVVGLHGLFMALLAAILPPLVTGKTTSLPQGVKAVAVAQIKNPILIAVVAGVVLNEVNLTLPKHVDTLVLRLGNNLAAPLALFALGGALARYSFGKDRTEAGMITALKLGAHPLIAWLLAKHVFTLPPTWIWVAVFMAAMPAGFQLDAPKGRGVETPGTAVLGSSVLAVVTITATYMILKG